MSSQNILYRKQFLKISFHKKQTPKHITIKETSRRNKKTRSQRKITSKHRQTKTDRHINLDKDECTIEQMTRQMEAFLQLKLRQTKQTIKTNTMNIKLQLHRSALRHSKPGWLQQNNYSHHSRLAIETTTVLCKLYTHVQEPHPKNIKNCIQEMNAFLLL